MSGKIKDRLEVEWFNVSYRTVVISVITLVLLVGGGGGFWFYYNLAPRDRAHSALQKAESAFVDAGQHAGGDSKTDEVLANAKSSLETARKEYSIHNYPDAMLAAVQSETLSRRVLSLARGDGDEETRVRFYNIEGDVRVRRADEFVWRKADLKMMLKVGDQIKTSSSSSVRLIYFDGTVSTLQPGSLIEIGDLYEDPVTKVRRVVEELTWGEVQASTQKRNVSGSFHEVTTAKITARSEGAGEFKVSFNKVDKKSVVDVFEGRISVETDTHKETVDAGERVAARANGALDPKQSLPGIPRLLTPSDQRVFVFDGSKSETVSLGWGQVPGADKYRLTIANGSLFTNPIYDGRRAETSAVVDTVAPGSYYWRVSALSQSDVEGPVSSARRFRVSSQQIRDRKDSKPPRLEITEFVPIGQMVIINGQTEPGATLWVDNTKIDVFDDGTFNAVVRLRREGANDLEIVAQDNAGNRSKASRTAYLDAY